MDFLGSKPIRFYQPIGIAQMSTSERDALTGVVDGMIIYNTSISDFEAYQGGSWVSFSSSNSGITNDQSIINALIFG